MNTRTKIKALGIAALAALTTYGGYKAYLGLRHLYYNTQYKLSPELTAVDTDHRKKEGRDLGIFHTTNYNTASQKYYNTWSTTGRKLSGPEACGINNKGFYEAVRCEGSGLSNNFRLYSAGSIKPTQEESTSKKPKKGCLGYTSDGSWVTTGKTIAVDPKVIPLGALVRLEFLEKNGNPCKTEACEQFNGWYEAEDTGGSIEGKDIDVYIGLQGSHTYNLGSKLPQRSKVSIAKKPAKEDLEKILENRKPRI